MCKRVKSLILVCILMIGLVACLTSDDLESGPDEFDEFLDAINSAIVSAGHFERVIDVSILDDEREDHFGISVRLALTVYPQKNTFSDFADDVGGILPAVRRVFLLRRLQLANAEFTAEDSDYPDDILRWYSADSSVGTYYSVIRGRAITLSNMRWNTLPRITGDAYVENVYLAIFDSFDQPIVGTYSGDVVDDIPHGHGVFTSQNAIEIRWTYTGEFKNGQFHGNGITIWEPGTREEAYFRYGRIVSGRRYNANGELTSRIKNGVAHQIVGATLDEWELRARVIAGEEGMREWARSFVGRTYPCFENFDLSLYGWFLENHSSDIVLGPIENEKMALERAVEAWVELFSCTSGVEWTEWWRWRLLEYDWTETRPYAILYDESSDVWYLAGVPPEDSILLSVPYILIRGSDGQVLAAWQDQVMFWTYLDARS